MITLQKHINPHRHRTTDLEIIFGIPFAGLAMSPSGVSLGLLVLGTVLLQPMMMDWRTNEYYCDVTLTSRHLTAPEAPNASYERYNIIPFPVDTETNNSINNFQKIN